MVGRIHPFQYLFPPRDQSRAWRIHTHRDMGATVELLPPLLRLGFQYGEPIVNFPPPTPPDPYRSPELLEMEIEASAQPGMIEAGPHVIAVATKPSVP